MQSLPKNLTSSLAGGELYLTDLKINGADPHDPFSKVNDYAQAKGFVFVNPAYALNKDPKASSSVRASLRNGIVMDGCVAKYDRPILLRLRSPEAASRAISSSASSRDFRTRPSPRPRMKPSCRFTCRIPIGVTGSISPKLVTHLYLDGSPENLAAKARLLAAEAVKPDAKLDDISYCWEAIGAALPYLAPLLTDKRPDVALRRRRGRRVHRRPDGRVDRDAAGDRARSVPSVAA